MSQFKVNLRAFGLEAWFDEAGSLAVMVLVQLFNIRFVTGFWEETLLIQEGKDSHWLCACDSHVTKSNSKTQLYLALSQTYEG